MKNNAITVCALVVATGIAIILISQSQWAMGGFLGRFTGKKAVNHPPQSKTVQEKRIHEVIDELEDDRNWSTANIPIEDGRLLRLLAESTKAKNVVEIGTSNGYSALWLLLALRTTGGRLTTFEIDPDKVSLARENFKRAGVDHLVTVVEGDAHREVMSLKDPIDLLFLDADKSGYIDYLNKLLPLVRPGGLILAHNII
ncbi:MAG: O-methyltransferase [Deltaproteobacteria bacterium]|nr:O-methyltransferase [Deltaproteobacteria bacterium]